MSFYAGKSWAVLVRCGEPRLFSEVANGTPKLFSKRAEAKEFIDKEFGFIDYRKPISGLRTAKVVRVSYEITVIKEM